MQRFSLDGDVSLQPGDCRRMSQDQRGMQMDSDSLHVLYNYTFANFPIQECLQTLRMIVSYATLHTVHRHIITLKITCRRASSSVKVKVVGRRAVTFLSVYYPTRLVATARAYLAVHPCNFVLPSLGNRRTCQQYENIFNFV